MRLRDIKDKFHRFAGVGATTGRQTRGECSIRKRNFAGLGCFGRRGERLYSRVEMNNLFVPHGFDSDYANFKTLAGLVLFRRSERFRSQADDEFANLR